MRLVGMLMIAALAATGRGETVSQPLVAGYNTVSIALTDTGVDTAAELLDRLPAGDTVWTWHARTGQWLTYSAAGGTNFPLRPGSAVMVRCGAGSLRLDGSAPADHGIDLAVGYNLLSVPASVAPTSAAALLAAIPAADAIWRWDAPAQRWTGWLAGFGGADFAVTPGDVLLVAVTTTGSWPRAVTLAERLRETRWLCYAPARADPPAGIFASRAQIAADLALAQAAGVNGIVTYGADGTLGTVLPDLVAELPFDALIMGIFDLDAAAEFSNATAAAGNPVLLGYCVGNEGLWRGDYTEPALATAIAAVRQATGKPVTTSEQIDYYTAATTFWQLGDWVFPTAHPWWHHEHEPAGAVTWTTTAWTRLAALTDLPVLFKEVGLPSGGAADASEQRQAEYYASLAGTPVSFCWFEAFDLPWKARESGIAVEGHWGLWRADLTPKPVVAVLRTHR